MGFHSYHNSHRPSHRFVCRCGVLPASTRHSPFRATVAGLAHNLSNFIVNSQRFVECSENRGYDESSMQSNFDESSIQSNSIKYGHWYLNTIVLKIPQCDQVLESHNEWIVHPFNRFLPTRLKSTGRSRGQILTLHWFEIKFVQNIERKRRRSRH